MVKSDDAIVALDIEDSISFTTENEDQYSSGLDSLEMVEQVKSYFKNLAVESSKTRVRVGIIDTGLAKLEDFSETFLDPRLTNVEDSTNDPTDIHGHGTQMAAIIASRSLGLAPDSVELVPLLVTKTGKVSTQMLAKAIVVGTNLGVEVMNISLSGETKGCTPVIGHLIFRAIEKGVFFSFSAGNGIQHIPEAKVGYPITAANDDGPLNFQTTQMPACWGKYFLGAITSGAIAKQDGLLKMPQFSNYGDDVELVAPGYAVPSLTLKGSPININGTSASAAYVSAAAALAIHHHKLRGFDYSPWYIENLLVQSAHSHEDLLDVERRPRFGSVLNMRRLAALLAETENMSQEERQNIPTINPRFNQGWLPGRESNLDKLSVSAPSNRFMIGENQPFKAVVYYKHNLDDLDVTESKDSYWYLSLADEKDVLTVGSSKPYLSLAQNGILSLPAETLKDLRLTIELLRNVVERLRDSPPTRPVWYHDSIFVFNTGHQERKLLIAA